MRSRWARIVFSLLAFALFSGSLAFAQQSNTDEGKRKVKSRVSPTYPELARRMNVTGKVKIEVVIAPDGRIRSTHVVGGHPLLVQACLDALKEWRYVPAAEESTQVIEFDFHGAE